MDKYTKPKVCSLPSAAALREALIKSENSDVRAQIALLFDEGTFVETSAFTKRGYSDFITTEKMNEFEGVISGYGAIDGKLVFAFAEDSSRMGGVIDERHAKKIADLYLPIFQQPPGTLQPFEMIVIQPLQQRSAILHHMVIPHTMEEEQHLFRAGGRVVIQFGHFFRVLLGVAGAFIAAVNAHGLPVGPVIGLQRLLLTAM